MYINKAMIYGNLTRDPEMKALPSGISVISFSVATNRTWKDKNGAKQESADYHNVVAFGKQAELIHQYVRKGQPIYLEGRIQTRSWDDKEGKKQYRTEIVLENFQFGPKLGGAGEYQAGGASTSAAPAKPASKPAPASEQLDTIEYPEEDINPDDIPF
jgi:single-strand DNA-binding protein